MFGFSFGEKNRQKKMVNLCVIFVSLLEITRVNRLYTLINWKYTIYKKWICFFVYPTTKCSCGLSDFTNKGYKMKIELLILFGVCSVQFALFHCNSMRIFFSLFSSWIEFLDSFDRFDDLFSVYIYTYIFS